MDALTIHEAAGTNRWGGPTPPQRGRVGLLPPERSPSGYRLYGPAELQRLRTLRELLDEHDIGLSDLAFALRLRNEAGLRQATDAWLDAPAEPPAGVAGADWLRFEQEKHQRLLASLSPTPETV